MVSRRWLWPLAALALVSSAACGSSERSDGVVPPADSGKRDVGSPPADTRPDATDAGPLGPDKTVGKVCSTNKDCDLSGAGINYCSNGLFVAGTLYPTPVCFGRSCDIPDPGLITGCDGEVGVCIDIGTSNLCFPRCDFDDSGAAPKGCAGKNACSPYGWGKDSTTKATVGIGFCFGGCGADSDCTSGDKCQVEEGLCRKVLRTYSKKVGDACTKDADAGATPSSNCIYESRTGLGFCSKVCRMGATGACPTGFTCDASLPKKDTITSEVLFTKAPAGLQGNCSKDCAMDADCAAYGGYCEEMAGTGRKTCQIGARP